MPYMASRLAPRRHAARQRPRYDGTGAVAHSGIWNMPIATLRFNLPDEQADYDAARLGRDACGCLWDIDQRLRSLIKYSDIASEETRKFAEEIREMIPSELLDL